MSHRKTWAIVTLFVLALALLSAFFFGTQNTFLGGEFDGLALSKDAPALYQFAIDLALQQNIDGRCIYPPELIDQGIQKESLPASRIETASGKYEVKVIGAGPAWAFSGRGVDDLCGGLVYGAEVYKDGKLIDKIPTLMEQTGSRLLKDCSQPHGWANVQKSYGDLNVTFAVRAEQAGGIGQSCGGPYAVLVNKFELNYPEDVFQFTVKRVEKTTDGINLVLGVENKAHDVLGILEIEAESESGLLSSVKREVRKDLAKGSNEISVTLPVKGNAEITITPTLKAYGSTSGLENVYGTGIFLDESSSAKASAHKHYLIGEFAGPAMAVTISNSSVSAEVLPEKKIETNESSAEPTSGSQANVEDEPTKVWFIVALAGGVLAILALVLWIARR